ncbi:MAG: HD domain-containing protein [Chloroflexi bacterium]|nr:HD domain-containing protein [Chloroflexota bacterium]
MELVGSLSLVIDLGLGQPLEHALRSAVIAERIGTLLSMNSVDRSDTFYVTLLRFVGCTAAAHEMAEVMGDEIAARSWLTPVFTGRLDEMPQAVREHVAVGEHSEHREQIIAEYLDGLGRLHSTGAAQCEVAQLLAARLGLRPSVQQALGQVFERWDGFGVPRALKAEQIAMSVQVAQLAQNAELCFRQAGTSGATEVIRSRAGSAHDPMLVDLFCKHVDDLLDDLGGDAWDQAMAAEPGAALQISGSEIDLAASAFADFADIKSPYTVGHSRGVAALAARAAEDAGLPEQDVSDVRRAALVHDVGRAGVPARIWDKAGPLTANEWERVRLHAYYTRRALARCGLGAIADIASHHHERLDGSGYPSGNTTRHLPLTAHLLAAADAFHAMTEPRPHRPALAPDYAAAELRRASFEGALHGGAVAAVLSAAGQTRGRSRATRPQGLTEREIEVIRLLARGCTDRQIADELIVSERTAHHHVEHIFSKLGVSTRAAATVLALQHGLLTEPTIG